MLILLLMYSKAFSLDQRQAFVPAPGRESLNLWTLQNHRSILDKDSGPLGSHLTVPVNKMTQLEAGLT